MKSQLGSSPVKRQPRRGLIRKWLLGIAVSILIWSVGGRIKHLPAAIRSFASSSDAVSSPPASRTETPGVLATGVSSPVGVPESRAAAPSNPSEHAAERRDAQFSGATMPTSERYGPAGYAVQVAAVPTLEEAQALRDRLSQRGYRVYLITTTVNQVRLHRVRVGPFQTWKKAQQVARQLHTEGHPGLWITN